MVRKNNLFEIGSWSNGFGANCILEYRRKIRMSMFHAENRFFSGILRYFQLKYDQIFFIGKGKFRDFFPLSMNKRIGIAKKYVLQLFLVVLLEKSMIFHCELRKKLFQMHVNLILQFKTSVVQNLCDFICLTEKKYSNISGICSGIFCEFLVFLHGVPSSNPKTSCVIFNRSQEYKVGLALLLPYFSSVLKKDMDGGVHTKFSDYPVN